LFFPRFGTKIEYAQRIREDDIRYPLYEIVFDFSSVKPMSIEFAKEYFSIEARSKKVVNNVNIPLTIEPVMDKALELI
jgi:hypothetical protein